MEPKERIIGYDQNGEEVDLTPDDLVEVDPDEDIDWEDDDWPPTIPPAGNSANGEQ